MKKLTVIIVLLLMAGCGGSTEAEEIDEPTLVTWHNDIYNITCFGRKGTYRTLSCVPDWMLEPPEDSPPISELACLNSITEAQHATWVCSENLEIYRIRYNELKCYTLANLLNERYGLGEWELFVNGEQEDAGCNKDGKWIEWDYLPGLVGCGE